MGGSLPARGPRAGGLGSGAARTWGEQPPGPAARARGRRARPSGRSPAPPRRPRPRRAGPAPALPPGLAAASGGARAPPPPEHGRPRPRLDLGGRRGGRRGPRRRGRRRWRGGRPAGRGGRGGGGGGGAAQRAAGASPAIPAPPAPRRAAADSGRGPAPGKTVPSPRAGGGSSWGTCLEPDSRSGGPLSGPLASRRAPLRAPRAGSARRRHFLEGKPGHILDLPPARPAPGLWLCVWVPPSAPLGLLRRSRSTSLRSLPPKTPLFAQPPSPPARRPCYSSRGAARPLRLGLAWHPPAGGLGGCT